MFVRSLRTRLIISHLIPLALITPLIGILLFRQLDPQRDMALLETQLDAQAALVAELVQETPDVWDDPAQARALVARVRPHMTGQIELHGADGDRLLPTRRYSAPQRSAGMAALAGESPGTELEVRYPVRDAEGALLGTIHISSSSEEWVTPAARLRTVSTSLLMGTFAVGGLIGWWLAISIVKPLQRLALRLRSLPGDGEPVLLPETASGELKPLIQAYNELAGRLRANDRLRRQMLATVAHELGRPLGALSATMGALEYGGADEPAVRHELLRGASGEINRLGRLLDDLEQLESHLVAPHSLNREPLDLGEWLPIFLRPWAEQARLRGLTWEAPLPPMLPTLEADHRRLAQALGNLISNAIRYTPEGGTVRVSTGFNGFSIWLRIEDDGPGIPKELHEQIFDPFFRGQGDGGPHGMGLGLTITRDVVHAHRGRVELKSSPGAGTRFTIYLPLLPTEPPHGSADKASRRLGKLRVATLGD